MSSQDGLEAAGSLPVRIRTAAWLQVRFAGLNRYDLAAMALMAVLAILAAATLHHYSVSNDEEVQQHYGELIVAYYRSGFADRALFHFQNLYLYGGLFDVLAVGLQHLLPLPPYLVRHMLCAGFGLAGLIATWGTARTIGGVRLGLLTVVMLAVSGPWFGSMFNHTKDIPFAAAMMGAGYCLVLIARGLPRPRLGPMLGFGILLGCALGLRSLGLLLLVYAGLAVMLRLPRPVWSQETLGFVLRSAAAFAPALLIGYVMMIALWPWAALAPFNPIRGLEQFGGFNYDIETILAGHTYKMAEVPPWYVPAYLAIKLPIPLLFGALLAIVCLPWRRVAREWSNIERCDLILLGVFALFPMLCEVATEGPAFTGMRHFLFVVPPLAVLAGLGWDAAFVWLAQPSGVLVTGAMAALAASLGWNAVTLVRLHPYEYLYYNPFVGGLQGAKYRDVMDYWANSMRESVLDLESYLDRTEPHWRTHRYNVSICSEAMGFKTVAPAALRLDDDWDSSDFFIAPTHMRCDRALPGKVIATVARLGVPIALVKDHRALKHSEPAPQ